MTINQEFNRDTARVFSPNSAVQIIADTVGCDAETVYEKINQLRHEQNIEQYGQETAMHMGPGNMADHMLLTTPIEHLDDQDTLKTAFLGDDLNTLDKRYALDRLDSFEKYMRSKNAKSPSFGALKVRR